MLKWNMNNTEIQGFVKDSGSSWMSLKSRTVPCQGEIPFRLRWIFFVSFWNW